MHAHETRTAPVVVKGHSYHLSASTNPDGTLNIAELKDGTAYWLDQYCAGNYSLKLFVQHKISNGDVVIIVRAKGDAPSNYDLDQVAALTAQWFAEIDAGWSDGFKAGSYKVTGEEHTIDESNDLIVFVRQAV